MKLGQLEKNLFLTFFLIEIFVFFLRFLKIVCPDQIQKSHSFYKKKLQNLSEANKKKF